MSTVLRVLAWLPIVGAGVAPGLASRTPAAAGEARVAEGPTCRIVGHDVSQEGVEACRDGLEAAAPVLASTLPWRLPAGTKLVVHVYADLETYAAAMRAADAPELADNWAATLYATKESHVVFQPRGGPAVRSLVGGVPEYTLWQVVHEAVHQSLARAGVATYDLWPSWLEEGLCEEAAVRAVGARQRPGTTPVATEDRLHLVQDALAHGRFLGLDRLLFTRVQAFVPERLAYAHAWSFVRFLAADPARLRTLVERASAVADPPPGRRAARQVVFEKAFAALLVEVYGPLEALEARWRDAVRKAAPAWFEPTRAAQWLRDGRLLVASFPKSSAQTLSTAPAPAGGYVVKGSFRIVPGGEGAQADLIVGYRDRADARFVKLALGADGYVTMLAYAAGTWQERYRVSVDVSKDTFAVDTDVAFALTVAQGRLRLDVGGRRRFDAEAPPGFDVATGAWGVGAWDGVVVWSDLHVGPVR